MSTLPAAAQANTVATVGSRPLGVLVQAKARNYLVQFPFDAALAEPGHAVPEARHVEFSPTGDHYVSIEDDDAVAVIRSAVDASVLHRCGGLKDDRTPLKVNFATFSPNASYLLTWARPQPSVHVPNLVVYSVATGEHLAAFHQKTFHIGFWPSIQWSDDESIAARVVTNTVHFFPGDALDQPPAHKLGLPGVSKIALSRGAAPYTLAAFIPGIKGAPARIVTYSLPDAGGKELSSRTTFRADSVTFLWSPKGAAVLALVSTNVDASGKNYYGESEVYYIDRTGQVAKRIELPKDGPTHDAAWSPTGAEFIVIYGFMPSRATMFNDKCEPVFEFGTGGRNTISFSPHGRFVALAGFGNLAGSVEFWEKNKQKLVGKTELPCTTEFSWSPCSRYFLAATTHPRLRVDNGFRVVRFDGKCIHVTKTGESALFHAMFRPALRGTYADPKATMDEMIGGAVEECGANAGANGRGGETKKVGVYRPPSGRGTVSAFQVNTHLQAGKVDKAEFMAGVASAAIGARGKEESGPSKGGGKKFVPGMDPEMLAGPGSGQSKAALARRRKKERAAAAEAAGGEGSAGGNEGPEEQEAALDIESVTSIKEAEKRAKKLRKKVKGIEVLKLRVQNGKELNAAQVEKVETEKEVAAELARVEQRITELWRGANLGADVH